MYRLSDWMCPSGDVFSILLLTKRKMYHILNAQTQVFLLVCAPLFDLRQMATETQRNDPKKPQSSVQPSLFARSVAPLWINSYSFCLFCFCLNRIELPAFSCQIYNHLTTTWLPKNNDYNNKNALDQDLYSLDARHLDHPLDGHVCRRRRYRPWFAYFLISPTPCDWHRLFFAASNIPCS